MQCLEKKSELAQASWPRLSSSWRTWRMRQDVPQKAGRLWGYNCVMRPESSVRSMPATSVPSWRADLNKSLGLRKPCPQRIRQKSGGEGRILRGVTSVAGLQSKVVTEFWSWRKPLISPGLTLSFIDGETEWSPRRGSDSPSSHGTRAEPAQTEPGTQRTST